MSQLSLASERQARAYARNFYCTLGPSLRNRIEPGDLESEALLAAWKAEGSYNGTASLNTWVAHGIRHGLLEFLRQDDFLPRALRQQMKRGEGLPCYEAAAWLDEPYGNEGEPLAETFYGPPLTDADGMTPQLRREEVGALLGLLTEQQRYVVHSYFWRETTLKDIARELDRSETRAAQLRNAALARLRQVLAGVDQ